MKVLLVNAPQIEHYRQRLMTEDNIVRPLPLHLGYLAAVLESHEIETAILDMNVRPQGLASFQESLLEQAPDLVGISSTTSSFPAAIKLAQRSKEVLPDVPTVMGGCHVTFTAEETLRDNPCVDVVVRGEGEYTLQELADRLQKGRSLEGVLGLSYRPNGQVVHNPPRPFIQDLDSLPWPARHLMETGPYNAPRALITSRGCPGRCIFCAATAMSGHRYRVRQPLRVVDEIEFLCQEYGFDNLVILDDTFTGLPKKLTLPVCKEIKRRGLQISWGCESRVDTARPELLEKLREAGCARIQFGVESGSPRVLAKLNKRITLDQVRQAVKHAAELGMRVVCSFILGHPEETEEDARVTLAFMRELKQIGAALTTAGFLIPFPGTEIYEHRESYGIVLHETNWAKFIANNPIISTRYLSRERLIQLMMDYAIGETESKKEQQLISYLR